VTCRFPEIVDAPRLSAFVSFNVTFRPLAMTTVPKSLPAFNVMSFAAPAASVVAPDEVIVPPALWVTAPPAVRSRLPVPVADVPLPRLTAPDAATNAAWLLVLNLRLVALTSMALVPPLAPMAPVRAFRLRSRAEMGLTVLPSVKDAALSVTVLTPKFAAPPRSLHRCSPPHRRSRWSLQRRRRPRYP